jgi:hypothetical protein
VGWHLWHRPGCAILSPGCASLPTSASARRARPLQSKAITEVRGNPRLLGCATGPAEGLGRGAGPRRRPAAEHAAEASGLARRQSEDLAARHRGGADNAEGTAPAARQLVDALRASVRDADAIKAFECSHGFGRPAHAARGSARPRSRSYATTVATPSDVLGGGGDDLRPLSPLRGGPARRGRIAGRRRPQQPVAGRTSVSSDAVSPRRPAG